jgi:hypothetical protein
MNGVVVSAEIGKTVKILLGEAAFKRFYMAHFEPHSASDCPKMSEKHTPKQGFPNA